MTELSNPIFISPSFGFLLGLLSFHFSIFQEGDIFFYSKVISTLKIDTKGVFSKEVKIGKKKFYGQVICINLHI